VLGGEKSVAPLGLIEGPNQGNNFSGVPQFCPFTQRFLKIEFVLRGAFFEHTFGEEDMAQSRVERIGPSLDDFPGLGNRVGECFPIAEIFAPRAGQGDNAPPREELAGESDYKFRCKPAVVPQEVGEYVILDEFFEMLCPRVIVTIRITSSTDPLHADIVQRRSGRRVAHGADKQETRSGG
jgi:hypothetical protein